MPLRMRLIALVGLVLLASLACGSVLVGWHAANSVRTELRAALDVGANTIRNGFDEMAGVRKIERESCGIWSPRSTAIAMCVRRCSMRKGDRSPHPGCFIPRSVSRTGSCG